MYTRVRTNTSTKLQGHKAIDRCIEKVASHRRHTSETSSPSGYNQLHYGYPVIRIPYAALLCPFIQIKMQLLDLEFSSVLVFFVVHVIHSLLAVFS